ncbi:MAG: ornithine cyclodeaminase family protein [Anaerolineae bacterium]|nr:ornithine cyclodeaminase family protein [Anaerolineae bacterium]
MPLLLLNEDELRQIITVAETIEAVEAAFIAQAEGRMNVPGDFVLNLPQVKGEVQVKGAYVDETPYYAVKVGSNFRDNPTINLPRQSGLMIIFDAATGHPAAIMFDNGYLTNLRAGAAGALTAKYLANEQLDRVAVIGSGNQAYAQIKALLSVRPNIGTVAVWGPTPVNVDSYARRIVEDHDLNVEIAPSIAAAMQDAAVIITTTPSHKPLIRAEWLKPGAHIIAVGSDKPNKQELHPNVLQRAEVIIVDNFEQCATVGEIHHGLATGAIGRENVQGNLGDLIVGNIPGRTHPAQITVADLTGLDSQDAAIGALALEKALFLGVGQRVASSAMELETSPIT